jgi:hypothetical protein
VHYTTTLIERIADKERYQRQQKEERQYNKRVNCKNQCKHTLKLSFIIRFSIQKTRHFANLCKNTFFSDLTIFSSKIVINNFSRQRETTSRKSKRAHPRYSTITDGAYIHPISIHYFRIFSRLNYLTHNTLTQIYTDK